MRTSSFTLANSSLRPPSQHTPHSTALTIEPSHFQDCPPVQAHGHQLEMSYFISLVIIWLSPRLFFSIDWLVDWSSIRHWTRSLHIQKHTVPLTYMPGSCVQFLLQEKVEWEGFVILHLTISTLMPIRNLPRFFNNVLGMLYNTPTEHCHTARCTKHEVSVLWALANKRRVLSWRHCH